ncbi:REP-associated tyrosine transposase [Pseudoxanthomonas spadix]|nr:transposase [Pseudoxanthomonas spadix]
MLIAAAPSPDHADRMPLPRSHLLRKHRFSESGRIYLITFATHRRTPYFSEHPHAAVVARCLNSPQAWPHGRLLCWTLMPDHWHGLLELGTESLDRSIGRAKALATRQWHKALDCQHVLWGRGFHDRAVRKDEDVLHMARYIVANPVRAGLVRRVGDYPYWNAIWL